MSQSHTFTCPNCGAPQQYSGGASTIQCPYCHTIIIVPKELRSGTPDASAVNATDWGKQANSLLQINGANSIATDGQGRIYVAFGNKIAVYAPDGRYLDTIQAIQNSGLALGFDANDHLWALAQDRIYELALNK